MTLLGMLRSVQCKLHRTGRHHIPAVQDGSSRTQQEIEEAAAAQITLL